jgi:hypothetical protein
VSDYEGTRRIAYEGGATFVPVCTQCGRFVKADGAILENDHGLSPEPNATCSKCFRTRMVFEGFVGGGDDE